MVNACVTRVNGPIIYYLLESKVTGKTVKSLLSSLLNGAMRGEKDDATSIIERDNLWL